ncbi:O-unit flippase-like protein [Haliovirga abyssi]|uniref:Polysaccharide biosynthesis protein C-terminal domain-containing protein n=1 Tax=Haliovirga abyssi TaxID=2996794 RepID=A0AAU9DKH9_9FUSO|nr:O-unit flippase-like protein [Haliovirga abyssi]BDU51419.1 hypothetical protein HLVA_19880 [Haliovirga abyssi]
MDIKISKKDIIWGYLARITQIGTGLFLLPVILKKLTNEEIGIWYIFLTVTALVNLLDFGFQTSILRNVSYVYSGAKELKKNGINILFSEEIDYYLLKKLIFVSKKIYFFISIIAFFLLITLGNVYIYSIVKGLDKANYYIYVWNIYIFSATINFYYYYYTPLLLGRGLIKESNKSLVYSKLIYIFFSFLLLNLGYGLFGIAISNLIGALFNRILSNKYFFDNETKIKLRKNKFISKKELIDLFLIIFYNSKKMGLASLGAFLTLKANYLIGAKYLSLKEFGEFALTMQIFNIAVTTAMTLFNVYVPKLNNLRLKKTMQNFLIISSKLFIISMVLYSIEGIFIILFGNKIIMFISNKELLKESYLIIIFIMYFLEVQHSIFAGLIMTNNTVPIVKSSILTGIFIIFLSFIFLKYFSIGILGLILSQFIGQLVYNNWKWPFMFFLDFRITFFNFIKLALKK